MNELIKFEAYLKEHSIPHKCHLILSAMDPSYPHPWNQVVVYRDKELTKRWFDVVWHKWSYGYREGLLELLDSEDGDDVEGYLTADDVIRRYFKNEEI